MRKKTKNELAWDYFVFFFGFFLFSVLIVMISFVIIFGCFTLPAGNARAATNAVVVCVLLISALFAGIGTLWRNKIYDKLVEMKIVQNNKKMTILRITSYFVGFVLFSAAVQALSYFSFLIFFKFPSEEGEELRHFLFYVFGLAPPFFGIIGTVWKMITAERHGEEKMKKRTKRRLVWNFIVSFFGFFLLSGCVVTFSFLIFFRYFDLPIDNIRPAAKSTFYNLLFVSSLFGFISTVWKMISVERPVEDINRILFEIRKGNFSAKLKRRFFSSRYSTIVNNINLMANELSSLDNLKLSLMSNISHELKTPISIINNYATLLQDSDLTPEKRREYAMAVQDSSKKMTELVTNILKLNQLENQKIPTELKSFNLSDQICECLLNFEDVWEKKDIDVVTDIDDDITINADMQLLQIVWNNLFSNAFKFTPQNGTVSVSVKDGNNYAAVTITDTGCGIPKEKTEMIFEKFYQCDTSRNSDGNGLGLALVRRIINITDSIIEVDSTVGKGTTFTVRIPK